MKTLRLSRLFIWATVMAFPLLLDSCKKDEDNPGTQPATTIEGSYKISALKVNPKIGGLYDDLLAVAPVVLTTTCLNDIVITFKAGGDVTNDNPASCQKSTVPASTITGVDAASKWTSTGNKLTITRSDGTKTDYTVLGTGATLQVQWQSAQNYANTGLTTYTYTMDLKRQ